MAVAAQRFGLSDFYLTSLDAGVRSLRGPHLREAAARILNPLSYPRLMEYQLVMEMLGDLRSARILDIGSPKLPALLLAGEPLRELRSTDIRDYFIPSTEFFLSKLGYGDRLDRDIHLEVADARTLSYASEEYDRVYSISVLEHIPDGGDSTAIAEIARVLKPSGRAAITVPFDAAGYREEMVNDDVYERSSNGQPTFYQRHYDLESLYERLIKPSGLRLERIVWFGEPHVRFEPIWNRIPMTWKLPLLWAQPFLAKLFLRRLCESQQASACGVAFALVKDERAPAV